MGFGSGKKKSQQLAKKLMLQLPYRPVCNHTVESAPSKESEETLEGKIFRRSENDASSSDESEGDRIPLPLMTSPAGHNVFDGGAYNLDDVLFSSNVSPDSRSSSSSLPHLQPTSYQDHPFARSLPSPGAGGSSGSTASYRWYMMMGHSPRSKDVKSPRDKDALKPFFSFGTASESDLCEDEYHGDDECEENVSLLHGGSKGIGNSSPMIPNIFKIPKAQASFSSSSSSSLWDSETTSTSNSTEDSTYLMSKSCDWSERQLAFDLDSVVDDQEEDDKGSFENALWMLQLEDDEFQTVPPPPLVLTPNDTTNDSLLANKQYKSSQSRDGNCDDTDKLCKHLGREKLLNESIAVELQNQARGRKGSQKRRSTRQFRHGSYPGSRSSKIMLYNKTTRYTAKLTGTRRNRRRRSWCNGAGRDFAPKLSTVAEQPSEEDEAVPEEEDDQSTSSATLETTSGSLEFYEAEGGNLHSC